MSVEPIGLIVLAIGGLCFFYGPRFGAFALLLSTLLGAATVFSGGLGNFLPAQVLVGFLSLDLLRRPRLWARVRESLDCFSPGLWLALTIAWCIPTAFILPRLFQGMVDVAPFHPTNAAVEIQPLAPSSANISQCLYLASDFACFLIVAAYANSEAMFDRLAKAAIAVAFADLFFAVADLVTDFTNTGQLLSFIRNANYRLLVDAGSGDLKRIVGSFPEASTFAAATMGYFAFTWTLWMRRVYTMWSGIAAIGCLAAVLFATSTTGYVALAVFAMLQYAIGFFQLLNGRASRTTVIFLILAPMLLLVVAIGVYLYGPAREAAQQLLASSFVDKLTSQSGVERSSWNSQGEAAFWGTYGLGAGLGSLRTSSWLIAVPASLGGFGALFYGLFVASVFWTGSATKSVAAIQSAAKASCFAQFVCACVAGGPDLGVWFFAMAAIATARPRSMMAPATARPTVSMTPTSALPALNRGS